MCKYPDKPFITILSSNLSGNRLGRALVIADCLKDDYHVTIIGMLRKRAVLWKAAEDYSGAEILPVRYLPPPLYAISIISALLKIKGDTVIAVKPLFSSFGIGLLAKLLLKKKLVVDIDDNEIALMTYGKTFTHKYLNLNPDRLIPALILQKFIKYSDAVTVSNKHLQERFGGEVITHARDPQVLTAKFDKTELKKRLGLAEDVFLIGHLGSYRPHKGLDRIVEAQDILNDDNIYFLYSANHDVLPKRKNIIRINEFPMNILPDILGACDLAVFPLLDNDISRYQFPAKIVDAMMLGIPFLVSNTEAIGEQLTPPEYLIDINITAAELAQRIKFVKEQKSLYSELADEMQNKAIAEYSVSFCANKLKDILNLMIDDKELS